MSRAPTFLILAAALLVGCAGEPHSRQEAISIPPKVKAYEDLRHWLDLRQSVAAMKTEQVVAELVTLSKPESAEEQYYFGLLNQQLQTYGGWTQARDAFKKLHENGELEAGQQQLAAIMQQYNQNRINWYHRQAEILKQYQELQHQLAQAEQERLLLEQKIQALTDLEEAISTRKEQ